MSYDYEQIPPGYYDLIYQRQSGVQSRWHWEKFAYVASRIPYKGRLLDIGCGPGTFVGSLDVKERQIIGIDSAKRQIDYADETYGSDKKTFIQTEGPPYPIDDGSVDVVTAIELIEHLDGRDIETFLYEVHRVLRPGGSLFLTTPNYSSLWPFLEWCVEIFGNISYDHQHISPFTRKSLAAVMQASPFEVSETSSFMFLVPFAALLGWKMADFVGAIEPECLVRRSGFLLFCEARKSSKHPIKTHHCGGFVK